MTISIPVKALITRNQVALTAAGCDESMFDGLSFPEAKALIAEVLGTTAPVVPTVQAPVANDTSTAKSIDTKEYLGIEFEERVYGDGSNRKVYKNAKVFGSAYANIEMELNGKSFKIGAINLQDLGETSGVDAGTKRGRAMLLRALKQLGMDKTSALTSFNISLNVPDIGGRNVGDDEFELFLAENAGEEEASNFLAE